MKLHVSRAEREKRVFIMREGKINFSYLKATYFIILLLYLSFLSNQICQIEEDLRNVYLEKRNQTVLYNFIQFYLDKIFKLVNKVPLLLAYYIRIRQDSASSGHDISKQPFRRKCIYIYTYIKTLLFLPSDGYSSSFFLLCLHLRNTFTLSILCVSLIRLRNFRRGRKKDSFEKKRRKEERKERKEKRVFHPSSIFHFLFYI